MGKISSLMVVCKSFDRARRPVLFPVGRIRINPGFEGPLRAYLAVRSEQKAVEKGRSDGKPEWRVIFYIDNKALRVLGYAK